MLLLYTFKPEWIFAFPLCTTGGIIPPQECWRGRSQSGAGTVNILWSQMTMYRDFSELSVTSFRWLPTVSQLQKIGLKPAFKF